MKGRLVQAGWRGGGPSCAAQPGPASCDTETWRHSPGVETQETRGCVVTVRVCEAVGLAGTQWPLLAW